MTTPTTTTAQTHQGPAITITGPLRDRYDETLTPEAIAFLTELHHRFASRRHDRLADRMRRRFEIGNGHDPRFRDDTAHIRADAQWQVAGAGPGLEDRRVEITGPTDPKMTINALNSGARVWLADQEDATSPTWKNVIEGQLSLRDAIRGELSFISPGTDSTPGKEYRVTAERTPTIVMRPRGWHLPEKHLAFTDRAGRRTAASGSLVDFGLYFLHNAEALIAAGRGPYFYLAKLESSEEAKLWDDVFSFSEEYVGIAHGTIRATILIETLPAAFEMDEILYELRDHCAGLNAGRWDYIFSIIKNYRGRGARFVLPDRSEVTMTVPFMRAYTELLVQTCHKRGAFAIGGMSAFIPNRRDPEVTARAIEKVSADKKREAGDGFDGTWVAHPDLIPTAQAEFDAVLGDHPNQIDRRRDEVDVQPRDLLDLHIGRPITAQGVRDNVSVAIRYLEAWLRGLGAVAIDNLMEDAATAEISRSQVWQWIHQDRTTEDGTPITVEYIEGLIAEVLGTVERRAGDRFDDAAEVFRDVALREEFPAFLTLGAYSRFLVDED
ncbi:MULTISPECIES: malate synthase A [unclassified Microbacterium]|uniref:malate synthase A n=1 Tax=unclassified Microbacterium TaxID=2609290 RepID=UPI000EA9976D|nr:MULTISPECIES: malate synthase A [unclassified Microbacterium]MBT2483296.1 malate synthase A [Microbacterium sp. ISL-108]RKN66334.1 malate synthase A [Microbacterium sp. CGR2]